MEELRTKDDLYNIIQTEKEVVIEYFMNGCKHCIEAEKFFSEHEIDFPVYKYNVGNDIGFARAHKIITAPTLIYYKNGKEVVRAKDAHSITVGVNDERKAG